MARARWTQIAYGDRGVYQTLARMSRLVDAGLFVEDVVDLAHGIVMWTDSRDQLAEAHVIRGWMARSFRFTPDALGVETLRTPGKMVAQWTQKGIVTGDCDDAAILGAVLGKAIGIEPIFHVDAFITPEGDDAYGHVYAVLLTDQGIEVDLDVTTPSGPIPTVTRVLEVYA